MNKTQDRVKVIKKVTLIGSLINLILAVFKIIAGITGRSSAMIADGAHSFSDLITDVIIIAFVKVSDQGSDHNHHYGHGKYETFATMLISFILMVVGLGILWEGASKIINSINGVIIEKPGLIAFFAALLSIFLKEGLFWYTKKTGNRFKSQAVIANAWHHRTDSLSSVGTAAGIAGAIFLGDKWRILDPVAGIIVSLFILRVAWKIASPSIKELLESSLPKETEKDISEIITQTSGVKHFHNLRTRKIGDAIAVDVHVKVDKDLSVETSHNIATEIENKIRIRYGYKSHIGIHIEPYYEKNENQLLKS